MRIGDPGAWGWVDGRKAQLSDVRFEFDDLAVHAGLGLFETIAVHDGHPLELEAHLERMRVSAERLSVPLPETELLRATTVEAALEQPRPRAWLKIVTTRGGRWVVFGGAADPEEEGRPVSAVLLPYRRNLHDPLAGMKTLNYAPNVLGLEEARRRGADEGIWLNTRGHLAEGCASNIVVISRAKLFTPSVRDGILPGVVRDLVLRAARNLRLHVHEGKVRLRRLETADEAFLTSSVRGVRPMIRFEGRPVGRGEPGRVTRSIAAEVARLRAQQVASRHGEGGR